MKPAVPLVPDGGSRSIAGLRVRPSAALFAVLTVTCATACAGDDASADDLRSAASWCARAARIARGWHDASLGDRYTRRTLHLAIDALARIDRAIAKRDRAGGADAARDVADAVGLVRRASDAVEARDAASIPPLADGLDRQAATLARRRAERLADAR